MKMKHVLSAMAVASLTIACGPSAPKSGIDLANLNQEVSPAEDFYEFACGGWMKNHPLPAAYSRYGSFDKLGEDNNKRINEILNELKSKEYEEGTTEKKLSELASFMHVFPQEIVSLPVAEKRPLEELSLLPKIIHKCEKALGSSGRTIVRYSGTENKIRLLVEAEKREDVDLHLKQLCHAVEEEIGIKEEE